RRRLGSIVIARPSVSERCRGYLLDSVADRRYRGVDGQSLLAATHSFQSSHQGIPDGLERIRCLVRAGRPGTRWQMRSHCCVTRPFALTRNANPGSSPLPGVVVFCRSSTSLTKTLRNTAPVGF